MASSLERLVGSMTVAQLARNAGTTVEAIVAAVLDPKTDVSSIVRKPASRARRSSVASPAEVDTRSVASRRAYDDALLAALADSDEPMSAQELRAIVGGTPLQARSRLKALVHARKVVASGKARATRYRRRGRRA